MGKRHSTRGCNLTNAIIAGGSIRMTFDERRERAIKHIEITTPFIYFAIVLRELGQGIEATASAFEHLHDLMSLFIPPKQKTTFWQKLLKIFKP